MNKRITDKDIYRIGTLSKDGKSVSEIANDLNLTKAQVYHQVNKLKLADQNSDSVSEEEDPEEENLEEVDWEYWAHFWKDKYLALHADKIMEEHLSE